MTELRFPSSEQISRLQHGEARHLLEATIGQRRALVVTDAGVAAALPELLDGWDVVVLEQGEAHKSLAAVAQIADAALELGLTRRDVIVGIGGGLVCDVAALAADLWMRGCGLVLVPTTLLAQVDAAIGGKTAVNYGHIKNLLGSFRPADTVIIDAALLKTLPHALLVEGMAELIKHAIIADGALFVELEQQLTPACSPTEIAPFLARATSIKAELVQADPTERGPRMLLNFGHTLGHAIEESTGLRHGRSVALGMVAAARLSAHRGLCSAEDVARIVALLSRIGLPTSLAAAALASDAAPERETLLARMRHDKKGANIVLLQQLGKAVVVPATAADLEELVDACP